MAKHHDHDHGVDPSFDQGPPSDWEIMSRAMQELLIEKGMISAEQIRARLEQFDAELPYRGPRVIARAWTDAAFKERLLANGRAACEEFGLDMEAEKLVAVQNTPQVHNVIVCTLCSCYPRALLGMPPTWYKSENYRRRVVREPRAVLREFGTVIPDNVTVRRARRRHAAKGLIDTTLRSGQELTGTMRDSNGKVAVIEAVLIRTK